jgi:hypothetical protein
MSLSYTFRTKESAVGESLKKCAPLVERVGQGEWNFILNNGSMLLVSARADEHWLQLDAPINGSESQVDPWQLLKLNQRLGGLSKVASITGKSGLRARAEISLDEEVDMHRRLKEACSGLKSAAGSFHGEGPEKPTGNPAKAGPGENNQRDAAGLRKLFEASGWTFTERSEAKLAIDLETRGGFYQAIAEQEPGGGVSLAVELTRDTGFRECSKRSIGKLLLRASAMVRLARPIVKEEGEETTAYFEVRFQTAPCASELGHALSALAVASRLCGKTADAMRSEVVAANYLTYQGLGKGSAVAEVELK